MCNIFRNKKHFSYCKSEVLFNVDPACLKIFTDDKICITNLTTTFPIKHFSTEFSNFQKKDFSETRGIREGCPIFPLFSRRTSFAEVENESRSITLFQVPPTGPGLQRQPSVGNVLVRASSFNTAGGPLLPRQISAVTTADHHHHEVTMQLQRQASAGPTIAQKQSNDNTVQRQNSGGSTTATGNGVLRQGSQGSLFEQIASQAKDLMRETTRQSSQDGLLAHMDKVPRGTC